MSTQPHATISIISIGQMGLGIAHFLSTYDYRILTNITGRSPATHARAESANITCLPTDADLVRQSDYIFSIVPPRDAIATATRIIDAWKAMQAEGGREKEGDLYYFDLNAIAPSTARRIDGLFAEGAPGVRFVDGGIIGGPPKPGSDTVSARDASPWSAWYRPGTPLSGPHLHSGVPESWNRIVDVLNARMISDTIGTASGLKCSFAALSKGFTALALQSYTTAANLGCLEDLGSYLDQYNPSAKEKAEKSITGCPPKAYRWVEEMNQIGLCFAEDGGWSSEANVFGKVAGVYEELADVVEKRGGTDGMNELDGAIKVLQKGLKEGKISTRKLQEMLAE
jgi:hypothetical protein